LLIDVINDLAFDGSEALVAQAESTAAPLARLKRQATAAGVPTIYIVSVPRGDYFVLKPKHSGFFDTTLDTLLETLRIRRQFQANRRPKTSRRR
jgi:nicotinamidase-related amidase